ncbi:MAG: hypothetical protein O9310_09150 [Leptospiraceae bacterium]|nr:hypothetical protein [Leptospiraceae bacterium]
MIKYSKKSLEQLKAIQNPFKKQITKKIDQFKTVNHSNVTKIIGAEDTYRLTCGYYRILIEDLGNQQYEVTTIELRRDVYGGH